MGKVKAQHRAATEKAISTALSVGSENLVKEFKKTWPKHSKIQKRQVERFKRHLNEIWGEPIECLSMILTICRELGEELQQELVSTSGSRTPKLVEAVLRLHARSCQISEEIIVLLRAGLADGAIARWRSLHEVTVVLYFISQQGELVARRYLDHDVIESFRGAVGYDATSNRFGRSPLLDEDWVLLRKERATVLERYGSEFDEDYGWAAGVLKKKRPKFSDIQKSVDLDHWRADYKFASHNVHAGARGIAFRLGTPAGTDLLAGSSDFGLCEPGQNTVISLIQSTVAVIQLAPTLDRLSAAKALGRLCEEAGQSFVDIHNLVLDSLRAEMN